MDLSKWPRNGTPGYVIAPDGERIRKVRSFLLEVDGTPTFGLFQADRREVVMLVAEPAIDAEWRGAGRNIPHLVVTDEGTWQVYAQGCACGSPLKNFGERAARQQMSMQEASA